MPDVVGKTYSSVDFLQISSAEQLPLLLPQQLSSEKLYGLGGNACLTLLVTTLSMPLVDQAFLSLKLCECQ